MTPRLIAIAAATVALAEVRIPHMDQREAAVSREL